MNFFIAFLSGAASAIAATLLHLQLPPLGILLALVGSALTIWRTTRWLGQRKYGFFAALGWIVLAWRAALPGTGGELLVQGDVLGEILVLAGSLIVVVTAFISHPK